MHPAQEEERRATRRRRSIAFFDHGEPSASETKKVRVRRRTRAYEGSKWMRYLRIVRILLQALLVWFAILTIGGLLLRGTGFFCKHTPIQPELCNSPWITSQEAILSKYSTGKTPTTKAFQELVKLNEISPSLQSLGLVMNLVTTNLASTYPHLVDIVGRDELEDLFFATEQIAGMAEGFSQEEYNYRQNSLLWDMGGINMLGVGVGMIQETMNDSSPLSLAFREHAIHRLPYGATWSSSWSLLEWYVLFVGEQVEGVREVVVQVGGMGFVLGDLVGLVGRVERVVMRGLEGKRGSCEEGDLLCGFEEARRLSEVSSIRAAVQWCQDVVQVAEKHYKNLFSELSRTSEALDAEMKSYRSVWPSKGVLSLQKLNETLVTEQAQIASYIQSSEEAGEVISSFENDSSVSEEESELEITQKLMGAIAERKLRWWL